MMELIRRVVLIAALCAALGAVRFVNFGNYLEVERIRTDDLKKDIRGGWSLSAEEMDHIFSQPLLSILRQRDEAPLQVVAGQEWNKFFNLASAAYSCGDIPDEWISRAVFRFDGHFSLWFKAKEIPWNTLDQDFISRDFDEGHLVRENSPDFVLSVRRRVIDRDDYAAFSGLSTNVPPENVFFPLRRYAPWIAMLGLILYFFLPLPRPIPGAAFLKRWKVVIMDFASLLLFFPFFVIGWFLAGPLPVGPNAGWIVGGVLWLMSLGGLYLFKEATFYSLFAIKAEKTGLFIRTRLGAVSIPYGNIEKVQGAVLRSPRWLITLLATASFFGKGSQRYLAGGQSLILSGARYPGIAFTLKNNGTVYLWGSGQGGLTAYDQIDQFQQGLVEAGVTVVKKTVEIRGFGTEPKFQDVTDIRCGWFQRHGLLVLMLTPFAVMAFFYLAALFI